MDEKLAKQELQKLVDKFERIKAEACFFTWCFTISLIFILLPICFAISIIHQQYINIPLSI